MCPYWNIDKCMNKYSLAPAGSEAECPPEAKCEGAFKQDDVDAAKLEGMKEMCETVGGTFDASTCTLPETTAPGKASGEGCYNDDECASGSCGGSCGGPCTNSPSHVHYCL